MSNDEQQPQSASRWTAPNPYGRDGWTQQGVGGGTGSPRSTDPARGDAHGPATTNGHEPNGPYAPASRGPYAAAGARSGSSYASVPGPDGGHGGGPGQGGSYGGAPRYDAKGPNFGPYGPAGAGGAGGSGPLRGRDTERTERRRPGWAALAGTAAIAALLASVGTAGLTGAFDDGGAPAAATATTQQESAGTNSKPVVTSTTTDPDWANVAAAVRPSVVAIDVQTASGAGAGSGVIIDNKGHVVTNNHVVGDAVDGGIQITLSDGRIYKATVQGTDPATDLAVVTITDPPKDLKPATIGNSEDVVVGDPVVAIGNPLGLSSTVTTGIVSALDRPVSTTEQPQGLGQQPSKVVTNAIQVDAAINPGNSGGPLFDAAGRVIGITSSIASMSNGSGQAGSIGLGFAIPSNLVKQVAGQLISKGVAEHAYLGVSLADGTATADGATRSGAQVHSVEPGTPAADAGLQPGDVITAINGDPVDGAEALTGYVRQYASGDKVTLTVVRSDKALDVSATLAVRKDQ